ncbi:hypothetical protein PYJP_11170 [Pyrofollis japonicus]|uniref:SIS domain-containing protein n=1 Tax=Pyrofollis japonicus TaxID=3060460 RepID=UPI00295AA657|nr:SIS domain-containing protein [Pyrofollis japonicus]BEP17765.1 hypothetical protein PYJP_11170 [Pyrofollis japonicus]
MAGNSFYEYYLSWANPARRAYSTGLSLSLPAAYSSSQVIVVCGMGGSGAAGDYLASISARYGGTPVIALKEADPPSWVSRGALVYAVSFSGNTRETLNCARRSYELGAHVVAVTTGGRLAAWARERSLPVAVVEQAPAPRAGWPQLFYTLLGSLIGNGFLNVPGTDVEDSLRLLGEKEAAEKRAEELASWLHEAKENRVVLAPAPYYPVAVRIRSELAENAKTASDASQVPESGHNILEGWASEGRYHFLVVDPGEEPWSKLLEEFVALARPADFHVEKLLGDNMVSKMVWGTWLAGLSSVKLAAMKGVDAEKLSAIKMFRRVVEETTEWGA